MVLEEQFCLEGVLTTFNPTSLNSHWAGDQGGTEAWRHPDTSTFLSLCQGLCDVGSLSVKVCGLGVMRESRTCHLSVGRSSKR